MRILLASAAFALVALMGTAHAAGHATWPEPARQVEADEECRTVSNSQAVTGNVADSSLATTILEFDRGAVRVWPDRDDAPMFNERTFVAKVTYTRSRCGRPGEVFGEAAPKRCDATGCEDDLGPGLDFGGARVGDRVTLQSCAHGTGSDDFLEATRVWAGQADGRWKLMARREKLVDRCAIE